MIRLARRTALAALALLLSVPALAQPARPQILDTMKRATRFMVEKQAYRGGYVWSYLPDGSRRWGEMEAYPTMIWIQPPGTATMGQVFLDAYHATGDTYYYQAAVQTAGALIAAQTPAGGWHYFHDFGGAASRKRWYDTIGKNAWRLEEFQHDWGNATFDDAGTSESMQFLLRLYLEKRDAKFRPALDKALNFVLTSQYPNGGWPQRFPQQNPYIHHGKPDYTGFVTFNDDVAGENVKFLLQVWQTLGDPRALAAVKRAMEIYLVTQQPSPQAGWGLQHGPDLKPIGARTYEPTALVTHTTAANVQQLLDFYKMTGDPRFLKRVPEALAWLDSVRLPADQVKNGRAYPTFVEIGTNRPLYVHRRGSNIVNGEYYVDHDPANTIGHYSAWRAIDVPKLRREYEALKAMPVAQATKTSPLKSGRKPLPRYVMVGLDAGSDLNSGNSHDDVAAILSSLNAAGWWPTKLVATSHPYAGDGAKTVTPGDYRSTNVGDATDTSPYKTDTPVTGISTGTYIDHMGTLIAALADRR